MYKVNYENEEVKSLFKGKDLLSNVVECFTDEFGEESISEIKEIFISDAGDEVRYFFYNSKNDLIYQESDKKSDLQ